MAYLHTICYNTLIQGNKACLDASIFEKDGDEMPEKTGKFPCRETVCDALLEGYIKLEVLRNTESQPYDYRCLEVNKQFEVLTGLPKAEAIGKTLKQLLHSSPEHWALILQSLKREELTQFEYYFEIDNRHFQVSSCPVSHDILLLFFLEITVQKQAEEALRIHRILFENAQDIILYIDPEGQIVDSNRRAQEKYGYTKEQLLTKRIQDIRHPSMGIDYKQQMQQAEAEGIVFEGFHMRSDGSAFPVEVSARGVHITQGPLRIHIIRDITKRKEQEAQIAFLATHDALTGIQNRGSLLMQMEQEIQRARRNETQLAVMLFDIDKFKFINDHYGHEAGDLVLRHVAAKVQGVLRAADQIGRLGGDEFVVLQTDIQGREDVLRLAERIHAAAAEPVHYHDESLSVSISVGISLFPGDAGDTDSLLLHADKAMYQAKRAGGNGHAFFSLNAAAQKER